MHAHSLRRNARVVIRPKPRMTSTQVDQSSPPVFSLLTYDSTRSMSSTISPKILASSRSAFRSHTASRTRASSTATGSSKLSPLRYHIFSEPLPYLTGLKLQHDIIDRRLKLKSKGEQTDDIVLLLGMLYYNRVKRVRRELIPEHTPTYTTGRRDNSPNPDTLHPEEKKVQHVGAEFHITKRGGQVTYHGPGQLVGYPILDLNRMDVSHNTIIRLTNTG